jgi:hypothetical protein
VTVSQREKQFISGKSHREKQFISCNKTLCNISIWYHTVSKTYFSLSMDMRKIIWTTATGCHSAEISTLLDLAYKITEFDLREALRIKLTLFITIAVMYLTV